MLSRTADNLYWMARYVERAENMARLLDVSYRLSQLPRTNGEAPVEWTTALSIAGQLPSFLARHETVSAGTVIAFVALDPGNPFSIVSCLHQARENARAERGGIPSELFESLNAAWLELREIPYDKVMEMGFRAFFDWVKERSHLSRGIAHGTLLRDDTFRFLRLGSYVERADNTARILDVKYHILLPSLSDIGGAADYYQWGALLRSVSAFESYRKVYRDLITPKRVAELLILRPDMPRSLTSCMNEVNRLLQEINGPRATELLRRCGRLHGELRFGSIDDIFERGLHEYLSEFLERIYDLGDLINTTYFWSTDE